MPYLCIFSEDGSDWIPKNQDRVCSVHFPDGKPSEQYPDPILQMGYNSSTLSKPRRLLKRHISSTFLPSSESKCQTQTSQPIPSSEPQSHTIESENMTICDMVKQCYPDHNYDGENKQLKRSEILICECKGDACNCCVGCLEKSKLIQMLKDKINELEEEIKRNRHNRAYIRDTRQVHQKVVTSDECCRFYTGIPKKQLFYSIFKYLEPKISTMRYWRGAKNTIVSAAKVKRKYLISPKKMGPKRKLTKIDEFLMVLMRLKLGLLTQDLADRFNVVESSVSSTFFTWMKMLSVELKCMLEYPPQAHIFSNLPKEAHLFPRLRCILDCTEIFIERPRHLLVQSMTWSSYKNHNTAKVLVGITPRGKISFISKAWGGRTSDVHIVNNSGFLELLDPYDQILADKGFTIKNQLLLRHAELIIPPGVKGQEQMLPCDVEKTKKVANFRIHVERAIARIKEYHILNGTYPINMLPIIDSVILVCAALCNFSQPLVTGEYLYT